MLVRGLLSWSCSLWWWSWFRTTDSSTLEMARSTPRLSSSPSPTNRSGSSSQRDRNTNNEDWTIFIPIDSYFVLYQNHIITSRIITHPRSWTLSWDWNSQPWVTDCQVSWSCCFYQESVFLEDTGAECLLAWLTSLSWLESEVVMRDQCWYSWSAPAQPPPTLSSCC